MIANGGWGIGRRDAEPRNVKNEERTDYVYENKCSIDKIAENQSGFVAENVRIP
jgi:hypothetical protein